MFLVSSYGLYTALRETGVPGSLFKQSLSKFYLVYVLVWHPPLHMNHCLLFTPLAHTIATCVAVLASLSTLYLELYLVA